MKLLLLIGVGVLVMGGIALMTGCGGPHKRVFHRSPEKMVNFITHKIAGELKLNQEQKSTLSTIKEELLARHKANRGDHSAMFEETKAMILADQIDPAKLNDIINKKMKKHAMIKDFLVSEFVEFHAILTPEQRQIMVDKLTKHHKKFNKHHQ
ncbi:Spy/CpxP family protein refolding chaperone [bacterium]|nr:Spy/CpxP family protein refolding chaperone [bacterium]